MSAIKETPDRVGTTFFRVKYGLDDFLEFFFGPFIEPFFWTILSGGEEHHRHLGRGWMQYIGTEGGVGGSIIT